MALTRDFKVAVRERLQRDPSFREALLNEALDCLRADDVGTSKSLLRDYVTATMGFGALGGLTEKSPKSLVRMLGSNGKAQLGLLLEIIGHLRECEAGLLASKAPDQVGQRGVERLARQMYAETFKRLEVPRLRHVVKHKITVMYGPPMERPDLALVTFQGGGGDRSPSAPSWPSRLVYLDDDFAFGRALRDQFHAAGLYENLEKRTVALAACFPEAPSGQAKLWTRKNGPTAEWREFSVAWVKRMLGAMRPRVVIVFGKNASQAMGLDGVWRDEECDTRGWPAFGRAEIENCPALYCQHLSQGWKRACVQRSLRAAGHLLRSEGQSRT